MHYTERFKGAEKQGGKEEKERERIHFSNQPNIPDKGITPY